MPDIMERERLAQVAYRFAEVHYSDKDARFDVIVECMSRSEIAEQLEQDGVTDEAGAIAWAKRVAGLQHEQELNQAWDGPESVRSSSLYDPAHDPAGPCFVTSCPACGQSDCDSDCAAMKAAMAESADWHRDPAELFRERHGL